MKKKYGNLKQDKNMILFPGTVERLVTAGHQFAENEQYDLAVDVFREAAQYELLDEHSMNVYAYSLYEVRLFQEAREVCELLLAQGPTRYIELMELYLSICMELREFFHVQQMIKSLLEEDVVPPESIEKFKSILSLSVKLSDLSPDEAADEEELAEEIQIEDYEIESFFDLPIFMQLTKLQQLTELNVRPFAPQLKGIIEAPIAHPIVQSIALYVLAAQQVELDITVEKFGKNRLVNPATLSLPDETPLYLAVFKQITDNLEKESSLLEMAHYLLARHILVTYPFEWFDYNTKDIVEGYTDYVHSFFGQNEPSNLEFFDFIQMLEKYSDIPEV